MEFYSLKELMGYIKERGVSFIEVVDDKFVLDTPTGKVEAGIKAGPDRSVDFAAYVEFARSGFEENPTGSAHLDLLHCAVGVSEEGGEVLGIIKKYVFHNKPIDRAKLINEFGDRLWYDANLMRLLGITLEDVILANQIKLKSRYPNGRDKNFLLSNRDHELEDRLVRETLESKNGKGQQ